MVRRTAAVGAGAVVLTVASACSALTPGSDGGAGPDPDRAVSTELPDEDVTLRLAFTDAPEMHEALAVIVARGNGPDASAGLSSLRLQVAISRGEVVEMAGDCFGDAVNVAARLLDHAGDNETLITAPVLAGLARGQRSMFRSLDQLVLRGRVEPVQVYVYGGRRSGDSAATQSRLVL